MVRTREPALGAAIRARREAAGMTINELARAIGCTWLTVHKWEVSDRKPIAVHRARLNQVLGV